MPRKAKREESREELEKAEDMEDTVKAKAPEEKAEPKPEAAKTKGRAKKAKVEEKDEIIEEIKEEAPPVVAAKKEVEEVAKRVEERLTTWMPKTKLGNEVINGKFKDIKDLLSKEEIILEPQIVDYLLPDLKEELVYIGGSPGKGGGIRRTPTRMTARMHKSGRRFKLTALVMVGNGDGVVGIGKANSNEHRTAIEKALQHAKLSIINIRRGCGSWECNCGGTHSIPFKTEGKAGSVRVVLLPTPVGVGIVADEETKKMLRLAGVKDVWAKTSGMTSTRMNLAFAIFDALRNLSRTKGDI